MDSDTPPPIYTDDDPSNLEAEPFLHDHHHDRPPTAAALPTFKLPHGRWSRRLQVTSPPRILLILTLIMFILVVSGMMIMMPVFRIIEDAVCRAHYATPPGETVDERLCKVDEVQSRLEYLGGWAALVKRDRS